MTTNNNQPKHTPGPWIVYNDGFCYLGTASGIHIAKTFDDPGTSQQVANAELIAAAPEMLEALGVAVSAIQELYHGLPESKRERVLYYGDIIGNAIAKAEGTTKQ